MIDKQQFDNTFQYFNPKDTIEIIDLFLEQYPEQISLLAQNIEDNDLVQVKWNAHKLKGICSQFFDAVSADNARKLEDTSKRKIFEIIDIMLHDFPGPLDKLNLEFNESQTYLEIVKVHSIDNFIAGLTGPLSDENTLKLRNLLTVKIAEGIPQIFSDLKISSGLLIEELKAIQKELSH